MFRIAFICLLILISGCNNSQNREMSYVNSGEREGSKGWHVLELGPTPGELSEYIYETVRNASDEELIELIDGSDCSVALSAGWEQVLRSVQHRNDELDEGVLGEVATEPFFKLVKQHITVDCPSEWKRAIQAAFPRSDSSILFQTVSDLLSIHSKKDGPTFRSAGESWIVQYRDRTWTLPSADSPGPVDQVTCVVQGNTAWVALFGWPAYPYRLYSIRDGKIVWTQLVYGEGNLMSYSGIGSQDVWMSVEQGRVVVYGLTTSVAYVEEFDSETGEPICKFSSMNLVDFGYDAQ